MVLHDDLDHNMMQFVVTGASGFIGSALTSELLQQGHSVVKESRSRLPERDYRRMSEVPGATLIHLAEPRDLAVAVAAGEDHFRDVTGVCSALVRLPWKHVIYVSSAVVYGYSSDIPHKPSGEVSTDHIYCRTKFACERMVLEVGGTVIRLANVYGPGMAANNVVSDILKQIPGRGPLTLRGITPVRDFLWIQDVAAGLARAAAIKPSGILNMGSGVSVAVGQLAALALRLAGEGHRPVVANQAQMAPSQIFLDISKTVDALQWVPNVSLEVGLRTLLSAGESPQS